MCKKHAMRCDPVWAKGEVSEVSEVSVARAGGPKRGLSVLLAHQRTIANQVNRSVYPRSGRKTGPTAIIGGKLDDRKFEGRPSGD